MKLEDLKALAGKKTPGTWWVSEDGTSVLIDSYKIFPSNKDAALIAAAANNIDALIKIADAAKEVTKECIGKKKSSYVITTVSLYNLRTAVEALETAAGGIEFGG